MSRRDMLQAALAAAAWPAAAAAPPHSPGEAAIEPYAHALLFAHAPYRFAVAGNLAQRPSRSNRMQRRPRLADHRDRGITTPNADTLYASAWLDLTRGPAQISLPAAQDRYLSLAILDAFTDQCALIYPEAPTRVLVAPLDWHGTPPGGARLVRVPGLDAWALARIEPDAPHDLATALARQAAIDIAAPPAEPFPVAPGADTDPARLVGVVNALLARQSPGSPHLARARRHAATGLGPRIEPGGARLTRHQRQGWATAQAAILPQLAHGFTAARSHHGWEVPPPHLARPGADDGLRAAAAQLGLGALSLDAAFYALSSRAAPLDGAGAARLRLPPQIPADAFWSLSAYRVEPDGQMFFPPLAAGRAVLSSRSADLRRTPAGSIEIRIQPRPPADPAANWLACAPGPVRLVFRAYRPQAALLDGRWRLPPIEALARN